MFTGGVGGGVGRKKKYETITKRDYHRTTRILEIHACAQSWKNKNVPPADDDDAIII